MKKSILITALTTLSFTMPFAWAHEGHHHANKKAATPMTAKDKQMRMEKMQEHMLQMHAQLHKIMDAKTPEERKKHMDEHLIMMKDKMQSMRGMMGSHPKCDKKESSAKGM